jgi:hypothetical protein
MPATNAWNETSPAGTDLVSSLDNTIRTKLLDVRERMELEHYWNDDTTNDGKHINITVAGAGVIANKAAFAASGFSLTGSNAQSLVDLSGTWNTTGTPTGIKLNVTDTASHASSLLLDLQVGGVSKFSVAKDGSFTSAGSGLGTMSTQNANNVNISGGAITGATLNASDLSSGTVPLARLSGILDAQIAAGAAIAWTKVSKTGSSLADLTTRSATDLTSGTLPDARFPATLPALSGANLTSLAAANLSGTIASAVQDNITRTGTVTSGTWSGSFGAVSGANLTSLAAGNISSGNLAAARLPTSGTWTLTSLLRVSGSVFGTDAFSFPGSIDATVSGATNNWAPAGIEDATIVRFTASGGSWNVTGLAAPTEDGKVVALLNVGSADGITLLHEDGNSTAENRFILPGGTSLGIGVGECSLIWYDPATDRWRVLGGTA